jgi:hypothetical protein
MRRSGFVIGSAWAQLAAVTAERTMGEPCQGENDWHQGPRHGSGGILPVNRENREQWGIGHPLEASKNPLKISCSKPS